MARTKEETITEARKKIPAYVRDLASSIERHGLLSPQTEDIFDHGPGLSGWNTTNDMSPVSEWIEVVDQSIDGYLVQPRKPLASLRNCWALQYTGEDLYLTWIDHRGWSSTLYVDHISMSNLTNGFFIDEWLRLYGAWPIREGLISPPNKQILQDEEPTELIAHADLKSAFKLT